MKQISLGLSAALVIIALIFSLFIIFSETTIAATTKDAVCDGIKATGGNCNGNRAENEVNNLVTLVVDILSWLVGVLAVIFVIWGGFKYVTSGGDSNKVSSAKNTIIYAIIGLVIVALAQVIVGFVLTSVAG